MSAHRENRKIYRIDQWSEGYFSINENGSLTHAASGRPLAEVAKHLEERGLELPVLVRFNDILRDRLARLNGAFVSALENRKLDSGYLAVYPIKVNQQASVVQTLIEADTPLGLEAGSKAELSAVIAVAPPGATIVCNGYKDREYLRMALIARAMGHDIFIVIEQASELPLIESISQQLEIEPQLGVRLRLSTLGTGRWQNSGGERGKFGLTAAEALVLIQRLKDGGHSHWLRLLHIHMGSQIAELPSIRQGVREAVQFYIDLCDLGAPLSHLDIGGGLGVDYEGARNSSEYSIAYQLADYAEAVVDTVHGTLSERGLPMPRLLSESGRALTAHHAALLIEVSDIESPLDTEARVSVDESERTHPPLEQINRHLEEASSGRCDDALFHAADEAMRTLFVDYSQGQLSLTARIAAEQDYYRLCQRLDRNSDSLSTEVKQVLHRKLAAKYFCNLSIFQSLPDIWGIEQVFPIVPLTRLDEKPDQYAVIHDLTCDSDGQIRDYACDSEFAHTLPVHRPAEGERYLLGVFLVGAYQEILGDMHNLFGDTHAVHVECRNGQWQFTHLEEGDRAEQLLDYVHYDIDWMKARYREKLDGVTGASQHLDCLLRNLASYTYLTKR
ncbi:MAG: biosynthetic arginine decarboxylase [Pseudomonadota bacterium]